MPTPTNELIRDLRQEFINILKEYGGVERVSKADFKEPKLYALSLVLKKFDNLAKDNAITADDIISLGNLIISAQTESGSKHLKGVSGETKKILASAVSLFDRDHAKKIERSDIERRLGDLLSGEKMTQLRANFLLSDYKPNRI